MLRPRDTGTLTSTIYTRRKTAKKNRRHADDVLAISFEPVEPDALKLAKLELRQNRGFQHHRIVRAALPADTRRCSSEHCQQLFAHKYTLFRLIQKFRSDVQPDVAPSQQLVFATQ